MPQARPAIYLLIRLPFDAHVDGACLEEPSTSVIAEMSVDIIPPRVDELSDGSVFLNAPSLPGISEDARWDSLFRRSMPWGSILVSRDGLNFGSGDVARVSALVARVRNEPPSTPNEIEDVGAQLQLASGDWASLFGDWLEVITGDWMRRPDIHGMPMLYIGNRDAWFYDGETADFLPSASRFPHSFDMHPPAGCTLDEWRAALRLAGEGRGVPVTYKLIRDARGLLRLGELRRAVLDAATAAEIAMNSLLQNAVGDLNPNLASYILKGNRDLGRLAETLRNVFTVPVPEGTKERLANFRNRAIHAGEEPSALEAKDAIDIGARIVELAMPIADILAD